MLGQQEAAQPSTPGPTSEPAFGHHPNRRTTGPAPYTTICAWTSPRRSHGTHGHGIRPVITTTGVIMQGNDMDVDGARRLSRRRVPGGEGELLREMAAELTSLIDRELGSACSTWCCCARTPTDPSKPQSSTRPTRARWAHCWRSSPTSPCCLPRRTSSGRRGAGAGEHRRNLGLREQFGGAVRVLRAPVRWAVDRQRPHPHPGTAGRR